MPEKHNPAGANDAVEEPAIDKLQQLIDSDVDGLLDMPDKLQKLAAGDQLKRTPS